jgi:hypothetical protein
MDHRPTKVLIDQEDAIVITWILAIQKCGLSTTLLKIKFESYWAYINKTHPIFKWCTKE